jgi:peptidoglycan/LPS O-acetylase OafA/YrhL
MTEPQVGGTPPPPIPTPVGPATTAEWRAQNENIGPIYRYAGLAMTLGALLIAGFIVKALLVDKTAISTAAVVLVAVLLVAGLLLVRPPGFDDFVKTVADRLPFIPYSKPPGGA